MSRLDIVVFCEARADLVTAGGFADRVIIEAVEWIDEEHLPFVRHWRGLTERDEFIVWSRIDRLARDHGLPPQFGHFAGEKAELDAHTARNALRLIKHLRIVAGGVLLVRDGDAQADRRKKGLEQARNHSPLGLVPVVIGLPVTKRECWILAAFEPADDREKDLIQEIRKELAFDPRQFPERLTAADETAKNNAKRILRSLGIEHDREVDCLRNAPVAMLLERGEGTGLKAFLEEVRTRFVPLIDGVARP